MKSLLVLSLAFVMVSAAEPTRIQLSDGTTFFNARIIAITGEKVTVVHEGGAAVVDAALFDLELLARAHMQLEEAATARKKRADEAAKKAAQEIAEADAEKQEVIRVRQAMAEAYAKGKANGVRPPVVGKATINVEAEIMRLKSAFPAKVPGNARVFIPRSGRNASPYIVSSTVGELPGGRTNARTTVRHNAGPGRVDTIQYEAPPAEVWSWYKSMLQTTTAQALPKTLQMIDTRLSEDAAKFQSLIGGSSMTASAQAQHTLYWFDQTLKPHLEKWRAIAR